MISWVIEEEFGIEYHPGHVRKILHEIGFSVQRPKRVLARADAAERDIAVHRIVRANKLMPGQVRMTTPKAIERTPLIPSAHGSFVAVRKPRTRGRGAG